MFCEECGSKLEAGVHFCENCGAPVSVEDNNTEVLNNKTQWDSVFNSDDWQNKWSCVCKDSSEELGIILTKSSVLCKHLSCSKSELESVIGDYSSAASSRGVKYYYLDLDNNKVTSVSSSDVENVISILSEISKCHSPKYVFILGNEQVVRFKTWKNESNDSDADVTSDFAFTTLNPTSPWDGCKYNFDEALRIGRLPTWSGESFSQFKKYFDNAKQEIGNIQSVKPFGLSAYVWKAESNDEFSAVSSSKVEVSPSVTQYSVDAKIPVETNLFLFNLHGSDSTKYWYGQEGSDYPEAFSPDNMVRLKSPNFIGVEACYGAMYENNKTSVSSNVLAAVTNNTIALLGASRIAYGTSCPPGSCADIVIGEFIKQIAVGETAGDAHILGLKKLCSSTMDDSDIKTLCEFALYGDPSACTGKNKKSGPSKIFKGFTSTSSKSSSLSHIAIPDVRSAVRLSLATVDEKILSAINTHIYSEYAELIGIIPKTYSVGNTRLYQSVYENSEKRVVKVYYDASGNIKKEISSK